MQDTHAAWLVGKKGSKYVALGVALLFAVTIALIVAYGSSSKTAEETVILDEAAKLNTCRTNSISLIKPERIDLFLLNQLSDFCYNQVRGEDLLGDFHVRKLNFVQQVSDSRILLWMVVAITVSGVLLAGLQLLAAYRLASVGGDFFIVYVRWVYPIQTRMDPEADASAWKSPMMFRPGGAGAPPQEPAANETKKLPPVEGSKP